MKTGEFIINPVKQGGRRRRNPALPGEVRVIMGHEKTLDTLHKSHVPDLSG